MISRTATAGRCDGRAICAGLRANRATTIVVRGQGVLGWWDRIPAVSVMRP